MENQMNHHSGNGATVVEVPDAPVGLTDNLLITSDSVVEFTWNNGISYGGSPIIDYKITYDQSINNFVTLETGVIARRYHTTVTLTAGATY